MYAENLYIALYDDEREPINYPVLRRRVDTDIPDPNAWEPFGVGQATRRHGLRPAARASRSARPRRATSDLVAAGEIEQLGVASDESTWLGAPLRAEGRLLGPPRRPVVLERAHATREADLDLLAFVGQHVALGPQRGRGRSRRPASATPSWR